MAENIFRWDYRISYAECTVGNHVYYSRYLDLLERARGEFFRHIGKPLTILQQEDITFPVLECQVRYHAPARYDDLVRIEIGVKVAQGVRVGFLQRILSQDGRCLVECETLHICAFIEGKPRRLPKELAELLAHYLRAAG